MAHALAHIDKLKTNPWGCSGVYLSSHQSGGRDRTISDTNNTLAGPSSTTVAGLSFRAGPPPLYNLPCLVFPYVKWVKFRLLGSEPLPRQLRRARAPGRGCARRERRPRPVPRPADLRPGVSMLAGAPIPGRPRPQRSGGEPCRLALDDRELAARPLGLLGDPDGRSAPESALCILIISGLVRVTSCENSQDDQSASSTACRGRLEGSKHACVRVRRSALLRV